MDARQYQIVPIAAPTEEERAQPYLWRFWRHLPRTGGRRFSTVRGTAACWSSGSRASAPRPTGCGPTPRSTISSTSCPDAGAIVIKFWLQISADEQLRRFKERQDTEFKRFKITEEDWRNRREMGRLRQCGVRHGGPHSTGLAPWTLVEANDKNFARVKVLKTICERLEAALKDETGKPSKNERYPLRRAFRLLVPGGHAHINAFAARPFVIAFGGKAVESEFAKTLAYDVNLLVSLGIRLVLVHGARPQIEEELREKSLESIYHRGYRVTDAAALECARCRGQRLSGNRGPAVARPAQYADGQQPIRVIGGNFITGQPIGVLDGIDMHYAGKVRKVDAEGINAQLGLGNIVLLNCEGPSPTGEIFNLQMEEAAEGGGGSDQGRQTGLSD